MTEVRFYHLKTKTAEQALPEILGKVLEQGRKAVIKMPDIKAAQELDRTLWTFHPASFLPHGVKGDEFPDAQPIWITDNDDNPATADILILTNGATSEKTVDYSLCCEMLDGNNEAAVLEARNRWKHYKEMGFDVTYWQQNERGGWEKKA